MQSMNVQPRVLAVGGEQFFSQRQISEQQQQQQQNMGPQVYSPQVNRARMFPQGMPVNTMNGSVSQDINNAYLLKQKDDPLLTQQQHQQQQQQQQQHQQQQQQQQQQPFAIGTPVSVASLPPGLNVLQQQHQQHQQQQGMGLNRPLASQLPKHLNNQSMPPIFLPPPNYLFVRDVWKSNLYSEFAIIRQLISQYNHVSISTEFVGTLARPIGTFRSKVDYHYQTMRANVDFLNPIQLGLSLSDANGNKPDNGPSTWQFNFAFDPKKEIMSTESLDLLRKSGINFEKHENSGIDIFEFSQLLMDSGLMMDDSVTWITYHAAYDLGFLINILMNDAMPNNKEDFEWWVHQYMPNFYDLNLVYKIIQEFKNPQLQQSSQQQQQQQYSLTTLADELGLPRFSIFTTTGGQSLLMLLSFCQLSKLSMHKFPNGTDFAKYQGVIYGIDGDQ